MTIDPTPNLGLKKIDYGSDGWDADEHANADKIDAALPALGTEAAVGVLHGQGDPQQMIIAPHTDVQIPLKVFKDPGGWVNLATNRILVPPGIFHVSTDWLMTPPLSATAQNGIYIDWADWGVVAAVNDAVYAGQAGFYFPAHGTTAHNPESAGLLRQTQAMYNAGQAIIMRAYNESETPVPVDYSDLWIVRLR